MSKDRIIIKINDKGKVIITNESSVNIFVTQENERELTVDLSKARIISHEFSHVEKIDGKDCYIYYKDKK